MWIKPLSKNEHDVPFAGKILSGDKDQFLIVDDDEKEFWISKNQVGFYYQKLRWLI